MNTFVLHRASTQASPLHIIRMSDIPAMLWKSVKYAILKKMKIQGSLMDKTSKNILIIFLLVLIFYILQIMSSILIPLVLAFLFASVFQPLVNFLKRKKLPGWIIMPSVAVITLIVVLLITTVIVQTYSEIIAQQDYLITRLTGKVNDLFEMVNGISSEYFNTPIDYSRWTSVLTTKNVSSAAADIASSVGSFTGSFLMFAIYYVVLLSSMFNYKRFLAYVGGKGNDHRLLRDYEKVQDSIVSYLKVKSLISLITGVLAFIILAIFDIRFAFFWAFLMFGLNFIPTIGSLVSIIPPILMGLIQFDSYPQLLLLAVLLMGLQFVMGSVIEPKL
jgi:AI-2 transport protein TqsA